MRRRKRPLFIFVIFPVKPSSKEVMTTGIKRNELTLEQNPQKLEFWDPGCGPAKDLRDSMPTVQGWRS